jgi:hypothetical protein
VPEQTPLEAICSIATSFYAGSGRSFVQLVRDSGVADLGAAFAPNALVPLLEANPALIEGWLSWSMNKRVASGWYFQRAQGAYVVGFYPDGEALRFEDASRGCAEFIIREVGQVMRSNPRLERP